MSENMINLCLSKFYFFINVSGSSDFYNKNQYLKKLNYLDSMNKMFTENTVIKKIGLDVFNKVFGSEDYDVDFNVFEKSGNLPLLCNEILFNEIIDNRELYKNLYVRIISSKSFLYTLNTSLFSLQLKQKILNTDFMEIMFSNGITLFDFYEYYSENYLSQNSNNLPFIIFGIYHGGNNPYLYFRYGLFINGFIKFLYKNNILYKKYFRFHINRLNLINKKFPQSNYTFNLFFIDLLNRYLEYPENNNDSYKQKYNVTKPSIEIFNDFVQINKFIKVDGYENLYKFSITPKDNEIILVRFLFQKLDRFRGSNTSYKYKDNYPQLYFNISSNISDFIYNPEFNLHVEDYGYYSPKPNNNISNLGLESYEHNTNEYIRNYNFILLKGLTLNFFINEFYYENNKNINCIRLYYKKFKL